MDIGDPIFLIFWQFTGGRRPDWIDTGDVNDDGRTDISDAIYTLPYEFTGDRQPPPPFRECGPDPTDDALGDCAYNALKC